MDAKLNLGEGSLANGAADLVLGQHPFRYSHVGGLGGRDAKTRPVKTC
jgi:hypothetical protein